MKYENPAKRKYVNREPIINGMVRFANPTLASIIAMAGAETITIDNEHYPFTDEEIINICRAIHQHGAECTVRLGTKNLNAMYRVMDMGIDGLLLPNVETAEEAQMIVDAIKYPPEGRRGCCPITRAADYGVNLDVKEYYEKINTVTTVGIMIESKKGYENLDEILKVKGIDYMVIGPSDFSGSFGKPGQAATDPEIKAAMKDAYERMYAAGVSTGGLAYFPEQTLEALKTNKTYLNAGSDLQILTRSFKAHIEGARKAIKDAGLESDISDPVEKLRKGCPVLAPFIRIAEPGIAEIIAMSGADFMIVDDEHFPFTDKEIISVVRAGHGKGCKVLVRPHDKSKAAIGRILDMGADGIMAPQVLNAEEAEAIVKAVKYGPEGNRGLCPITAGADYGFGHSAQDYAIQANKKTVVGIMIETKSAVEDLDRILAVPGIDFITFGPSDLSNSYGVPGQYDSDLIKGVIRTIREKTRKAGIALNSIAYSDEAVVEELKEGATVLNIGSDVQYMIWGWTKLIADTKKVIEEFKG
ncbi:MAG: hypothetical protein ILP16_03640 [Spirochaetales bacterium]|nr:hypothetical protein [Spirochaetales bacterium]